MNAPDDGAGSDPIAEVLSDLQTRLDGLPPDLRAHVAFLSTYLRTTQAVEDAVRSEVFEDPTWVSAWDEAFARLYLAALDARISGQARVPRPWRLAFQAPATLPPLRHVLLGINAHTTTTSPKPCWPSPPNPTSSSPAWWNAAGATTAGSTPSSPPGSPPRTRRCQPLRRGPSSTARCNR